MRHRLALTLATLAAGNCAATIAQAQNSVVLYGSIDSGVAYVRNVAGVNGANSSSEYRFASGTLHGNRWGLRGAEQLGGGLKAIFVLENGFDLGTGAINQGGRQFGRQAAVGLADETLGTIVLGRQYDPNVDLILPLTADPTFGKSFGTPGDSDNYDDTVRVNNSLKYISPSNHGFTFELIYGLGGTAGSTGQGQTYGAGVRYDDGPLGLAAGYYYADGGRTVVGGVRTWNGSSDSIFNSVINSGFASAKSVRIARIAAKYAKDDLTVGISYSNTQFASDVSSAFTRSENFSSAAVFSIYKITEASGIGLGYIYTKSSGASSATYNQFNLGFDYSLSKNTELYALAAWQKASGTTLDAMGRVITANASIGSFGADSGTDTQGLIALGVRHQF